MTNVIDMMAVKAAREGNKEAVWQCPCGCQKYMLTEEGPQCFDCGRWWEWAFLLRKMGIDLKEKEQ